MPPVQYQVIRGQELQSTWSWVKCQRTSMKGTRGIECTIEGAIEGATEGATEGTIEGTTEGTIAASPAHTADLQYCT
jgi:hypothetical protein